MRRRFLRRSVQSVQLELADARVPSGRGGWRPGAGRPRGRTKVAHEQRAAVASYHPLHVTLRIVDDVPSLRQRRALAVVRSAIAACGRAGFRVIHFNVRSNHIHLIVEAADADALAHGMQGLMVRLARRLNRLFGRRGTLFADRYHARSLTTPSEVRNALRYVLLNDVHHAPERARTGGIDPFSSGAWFDGWLEPPTARERADGGPPTSFAQTWLLSTGWKRRGLISRKESPAPARRSPARGATPHRCKPRR